MSEILKIPMALRAAYLSVHRQTNAILSELGITADQFVCLHLLHENGELIQTQIVKLMNSDPNTVSAIVRLLESKGYVEKLPHVKDRRARTVAISAKGEEVLKMSSDLLTSVHEEIATEFRDDEARQLNELLRRYAFVLK